MRFDPEELQKIIVKGMLAWDFWVAVHFSMFHIWDFGGLEMGYKSHDWIYLLFRTTSLLTKEKHSVWQSYYKYQI